MFVVSVLGTVLLLTTTLPTPHTNSLSSVLSAQTIDLKSSDWPVFLGPHQSGISSETNLIDHFPEEGPPLLWEKRLERGCSTPFRFSEIA